MKNTGHFQPSTAIRLVHGEPQAQQALALSLRHRYPQICVEQTAVLFGRTFAEAACTLLRAQYHRSIL